MRRLFSIALVLLFLPGCAYKTHQDVEKQQESIRDEHQETKKRMGRLANGSPTVEDDPSNQSYWFFSSSDVLKQTKERPDLFQKPYALSGDFTEADDPRLKDVVRLLNQDYPVDFRLTQTLRSEKEPESGSGQNSNESDGSLQSDQASNIGNKRVVSMHRTLPLEEMLNRITAQTNTYWDYSHSNRTVRIYRYKTRTFELDSIPGTLESSLSISKNRSGGGSEGSEGSGSEGSGGQSTSFTTEGVAIWSMMESSLNNMIGDQGFVSMNKGSGSITVQTTPDRMEKIARFVETQNKMLKRQVVVTAELFSVEINNQNSVRINWDAVFSDNNSSLSANIASQNVGIGQSASVLELSLDENGSSEFSGSQAVVNSLRQNGNDVSLITRGAVTTTNNVPASIQSSIRQGYLESITQTQTQQSVSTSLEDGEFSTGFFTQIHPHVLAGREVVLRFNMDLSTLIDLQEFTSGQGERSQTIQIPSISQKKIQQNIVMEDGNTLILSGFQQTERTADQSGGIFSGYGEEMSTNKTTLVLVMNVHTLN